MAESLWDEGCAGHRGRRHCAIAERLSEDHRVLTAQRQDADIRADLRDPSAPVQIIEEIIKREGRLDVLINNAGQMVEARADQHRLEDWNATLALNLTAPFLLIKHALPHLSQTKGSIVNIGSIEVGGNPEHAAYCASKVGLHGLTQAVAVDAGPMACGNAGPRMD